MVEQSFWEMLRTKRDSLTKSGIIVADYLLQHAEDAQYLSISSLAKACGVAEATIFRFCRSLGFDGYNEMTHSDAPTPSAQGAIPAACPAPGTSVR